MTSSQTHYTEYFHSGLYKVMTLRTFISFGLIILFFPLVYKYRTWRGPFSIHFYQLRRYQMRPVGRNNQFSSIDATPTKGEEILFLTQSSYNQEAFKWYHYKLLQSYLSQGQCVRVLRGRESIGNTCVNMKEGFLVRLTVSKAGESLTVHWIQQLLRQTEAT